MRKHSQTRPGRGAGPAPVPQLAGIETYQPGKPLEAVKRELGLRRVVKLASNENPLGPSPRALAAARRDLAQCHRYPDGSCHDLRRALSRAWRLPPDHFVFGDGSNEILMLACQAYCGQGDRVAFSAWSFSVYRSAALSARAVPVEVPSPDFRHDLAALAREAMRAKLVFLCNPNNPTGSWHPPAALEAFLGSAPRSCLVVLDEAYAEYAGQTFARDRGWLKRFPNLLVCRTFSKAYGLAGLRVGYGVAAPPLLSALEKLRQPFNLNRVAQSAALAALADGAFVRRTLDLNRRGLAELGAFLRSRGLWHLPSRANFLFFRQPARPAPGAGSWFDFLLGRGVIVRPQPGGYLRINTGTREENLRFMRALDAGLKGRPEHGD